MNKTVDKEIKQVLKQMQDNRQRWRQETNKAMSEDEAMKMLKRMQFKRQLLTDKEDATPADWEALADEYEEKGFLANASSCRERAKKMRKITEYARQEVAG